MHSCQAEGTRLRQHRTHVCVHGCAEGRTWTCMQHSQPRCAPSSAVWPEPCQLSMNTCTGACLPFLNASLAILS